MTFLQEYIKDHSDEYHKWEIERAGFMWFALTFLICYLCTKRIWVSLVTGVLFLWLISQEKPKMILSKDDCTLRIINPLHGPGFPKLLFPRHVASVVYRILFPGEKTYEDVRRVAGSILNMSSPEVVLRVYQPEIPMIRRQIIITNHTHTPIRDAICFFAFPPKTSEIVIVQHNFHWVVTAVSRRLYGAWTIDKDDKSKSGKRSLVTQLTKLLEYMRSKRDLTVIIYPAGKVPKTPDEEIGKFYPGAFYLALMSGYPITPLVNRYTKEGVFSSSLHPTIDICSEYASEIIQEKTIEGFRTSNVNILNEICERFRRYFLPQGHQVEKSDQIVQTPLHG